MRCVEFVGYTWIHQAIMQWMIQKFLETIPVEMQLLQLTLVTADGRQSILETLHTDVFVRQS